ncbi:MAG: SLC5 family protein [Pseudomonadota bacterium]
MFDSVQLGVFIGITALIGFLTYLHCRKAAAGEKSSGRDYFLANGGLKWYFVAGSITLTNLSTDQLVGMNGNQMLLLAWWEFAAVCGLFILAFVFLPIYYRNECTTTTELLQKKYGDKNIRALISLLFILGNLFIFLPVVLYGGSLFMLSMFDVQISLMYVAMTFAAVGAAYAILGGLRAVAVSDTYSGVLILSLALLLVYLALKAIDFDLTGVPAERLTLIGDNDSPIPWHTLLTGMIFIQIFYWSTNQTITQRAMAAPSVKEARKGVLVAAAIRLMIVPIIVTIPGIVAFKLYGDINDAAYGRIVGDLLPVWLSGAFGAAIAAAVLTTFNSILNASAALYVCDIHEAYFKKVRNVPKLSGVVQIVMVLIGLSMVPVYMAEESLINILQERFGFLSMPILGSFIVALVFRNVDARAAIAGVIAGVTLYGYLTLSLKPFHYIHCMFVTLFFCIGFSLLVNRLVFGRHASFATKSADTVPASG